MPIRITEVELSAPIARIAGGPSACGGEYRSARVLVRLYHEPIGMVELDLSAGPLAPAEVEARIWSELGSVIRKRLETRGTTEEQLAADRGSAPAAAPSSDVPAAWNEWPLVSVVICTFARPLQLKAALTALLDQSYPNYEIVVVDNAPPHQRVEEWFQAEYGDNSQIRYLWEPERGVSRAKNRGVGAARGPVVAFTDDDIVVDRHWIASLVRGFDAEGTIACVTGLTLAAELETEFQLLFERYGAFNHGYEPQTFSRNNNPTGTALYPYTAGVVGGGGNCAVRTELLPWKLTFDPGLGPGSFAYSAEDLDVFLQLLLGGHSIRYEPAAISWHAHRRGYADLRWQLFTYGSGLTFILTKLALRDRAVALDLLRRAPRIFFGSVLVAPRDAPPAVGKTLNRLERLGLMYGPVAYLISRFRRFVGSP